LRKIIGERVSKILADDGSYVQDVPSHPASIRIYRFAGSTDIKEIDNGKTLAELKFKPNETITAFKKYTYTSNRVPLLDNNG
jgi:hypothetical protein